MEEPKSVESTNFGSPKKSQANQLLERLVLRDPYQDYWSNVILWISLAESLLPSLVVVLECFAHLATTGRPSESFGYLLATLCATLGIGFTLLFAVTLLVAGLASAIVGFVCRTLNIPPNGLLIGVLAGGCVGILVALPLAGINGGPNRILPTLFLLLPVLLGQAGGAYGAWRTYYRLRRSDQPPGRIRFGLRQLLVLTTWMAVLMTVLKLVGMTTADHVQLLGTWAVLQAVGMFAAWMWERHK